MVSNEERRRVAQNLRSSRYRLKPVPSGKQFMSMIRAASELELAHEMNYLTQSGFERLADLIDRPTTKRDGAGGIYWRCTRCGAFNRKDAVTDCCGVIPSRFCANCGAGVVE